MSGRKLEEQIVYIVEGGVGSKKIQLYKGEKPAVKV